MSATVAALEEIRREAAYHKQRLNYHKRQLRAVKELEAQYAEELRQLGIRFISQSEGDNIHGSTHTAPTYSRSR